MCLAWLKNLKWKIGFIEKNLLRRFTKRDRHFVDSETYLTTLRSFIILRPGDGFSSFVKITVLFIFWG